MEVLTSPRPRSTPSPTTARPSKTWNSPAIGNRAADSTITVVETEVPANTVTIWLGNNMKRKRNTVITDTDMDAPTAATRLAFIISPRPTASPIRTLATVDIPSETMYVSAASEFATECDAAASVPIRPIRRAVKVNAAVSSTLCALRGRPRTNWRARTLSLIACLLRGRISFTNEGHM
eukprot:scaffold244_cov416-Prasinococcus_capsulatus_cf.AAC.3